MKIAPIATLPVRARYDVTPMEVEARWSPGSGIRVSPTGVSLSFWVHPQAHISAQSKVDEKTRTVTVVLDAFVDRLTRPAELKKDLFVETPRPDALNKQYTLVVKNADGKVLYKGAFFNALPC